MLPGSFCSREDERSSAQRVTEHELPLTRMRVEGQSAAQAMWELLLIAVAALVVELVGIGIFPRRSLGPPASAVSDRVLERRPVPLPRPRGLLQPDLCRGPATGV